MSLFKEIEKISEYIISIRKLEKYFSFDMSFPGTWSILKSQVDETKTVFTKSDDKVKTVSFISEMSDESMGETIYRIENIVNYNLEREEKQRLFQQKVSELKNLFEKESLDELKNLKFDKDEIPKLEGEESIS
jgi:hypothetical protein